MDGIDISFLSAHNQDHLIRHYRGLNEEAKKIFAENLRGADCQLALSLYQRSISAQVPARHRLALCSAPIFRIPQTAEEKQQKEAARLMGESMLRDDRVAVVVAAAGHGSRLGFSGPKGMFPISPIKNKTFFQLFSEAIRFLSARYRSRIPFLIMVNRDSRTQIADFFLQHAYFGLPRDTVYFFEQGSLPSVTPEGKLALKNETELFTNPNGHGGCIKALHHSGLLSRLIEGGYSDLFYFQVDNPLVVVADPVFLGYHAFEQSEMSTKIVRRKDCEEKVGIFVSENGRAEVLEYSELAEENRCVLDQNGQIRDWAGNTGIHILSLPFLRRLFDIEKVSLPYHRAIKKETLLEENGSSSSHELWKFEMFIFDAIPLARKTCCMEIVREHEFAPLKNCSGADSPETVRMAMSQRYKDLLDSAGVRVALDARVEISPLYGVTAEDIIERAHGGLAPIVSDYYLE